MFGRLADKTVDSLLLVLLDRRRRRRAEGTETSLEERLRDEIRSGGKTGTADKEETRNGDDPPPYSPPQLRSLPRQESHLPPREPGPQILPLRESRPRGHPPRESHLRSHGGWSMGGPLSIELFPIQLTLGIVQSLSPADRAALALASHTLMRKLGRGSFILDADSRYNLLTRLERDGILPSHILCPTCQIFHLPSLPRHWVQAGHNRITCPIADWENQMSRCEEIPKHLRRLPFSFSTVAAILRSIRHNWGIYPRGMLSDSVTYRLGDSRLTLIAHRKQDPHIINGRMMLKTQTELYSRAWGRWATITPRGIKQMMRNRPELRYICPHLSWISVFEFIFQNMDILQGYRGENHSNPLSNDLPCSTSWSKGDVHDALRGYIACAHCYTDFQIRKQDSEERGMEAVVLKTRHNFGGGESVDNAWWTPFVTYDQDVANSPPMVLEERYVDRFGRPQWSLGLRPQLSARRQ